MNNNFMQKVVTLDNDSRWYITDETEQNGDKYYLGVKINPDNNFEMESKIFKEIKSDGKVFLDDQIDNDTYTYLTAIFVANFESHYDEIMKKIKEEVE